MIIMIFIKKIIKNYFIYLFLIQIVFVYGLFIVIHILDKDVSQWCLFTDGYYNNAKLLVEGKSILHKGADLGLPLLYTPLFLFNAKYHPIINVTYSVIISFLLLIINYKIFINILTNNEWFWGTLIVVLNPMFAYYTLRPHPEIFLALFMGLFIWYILQYYKYKKYRYLLLSLIIFLFAMLIKPKFILIPFTLFLGSLLIKEKRLVYASLILLIVTVPLFKAYSYITSKPSENNLIGSQYLIGESYWMDYIIKTGQFHKGHANYFTSNSDKLPEIYKNVTTQYDLSQIAQEWIKNYYEKYPNSSGINMNLHFIKENPYLVLQNLLASPFFFFMLGTDKTFTVLLVPFTLVAFFLAILGIKKRYHTYGNEIIIILSIIIGYSLLHFLTHSYSRYSLPVLPFFYVFGGIPIIKIINKIQQFWSLKKQKYD